MLSEIRRLEMNRLLIQLKGQEAEEQKGSKIQVYFGNYKMFLPFEREQTGVLFA